MKKISLLSFVTAALILLNIHAFGQSLTYDPGNGLHFKSDDNKLDFLFTGYINSIFAYHNEKQNGTVQNSFSVRRARIDLGFNYSDDYGAFFEFEAAGQRTAMVLAQIQLKLYKNNYLMAGKYIDPFSAENTRSTSRISTIERYSGINSIFLLPGLDTQFGIMLFGSNSETNLEYYLSITNGNGAAGQNISENNDSKSITGRLNYKFSRNFKIGGSVSYAKEQQQVLSLLDHTFDSFNNASVMGKRIGYLANFEFNRNPVLFRGEAFVYNFDKDLSLYNQVSSFAGGYLEAGYFIKGNAEDGFRLIGRLETARYGSTLMNFTGPTVLNSFIIGTDLLMDNIISFKVNLIYEKANRNSLLPASRFTNNDEELLLLTSLQFRF